MADEAEISGPTFKPGWPSFLPAGLIVGRTLALQVAAHPDEPVNDDAVRWSIFVTANEDGPFALIMVGELAVRNESAYASASIAMPLDLRDPPDELDDDFCDGFLLQYGEWVSSLMYDHAALALRAAVAGNGLVIDVPYETPDVVLRTSADVHAEERAHGRHEGEPDGEE
jgi:hypothetical protein